MTATQMNMRIDSHLKAAGDLSIRESGSTPTKIVHAVWGYAARNRHKPQAMRDLLAFLADEDEGAPLAAELGSHDAIEEQVMRGPLLVSGYLSGLGIEPSAIPATTYDEVKEAAFADEWEGALGL